jgi:hypothetical protein
MLFLLGSISTAQRLQNDRHASGEEGSTRLATFGHWPESDISGTLNVRAAVQAQLEKPLLEA